MISDKLNRDALLACCGSSVWADRMTIGRPYESADALHEEAERTWWSLRPEDWLEAFAQHPKIGQQSESKWSTQEQKGMTGAATDTARAIREKNEAYEQRFGWIFIVCATGKTAEEMRSLLEQRLSNSPEEELQIAAAEQAKIMHLRLNKILAE